MTVQPADIEPEEQRGRAPAAADYRYDPRFTPPQRVPWSQLSPYFTAAWGRADPGNPQPEHVEEVGQTGSGKTRLMMHMLQDRYTMRHSGAVIICTKADDTLFGQMGWPIVRQVSEVAENPNVIFWPRTRAMGNERRAFHELQVGELLHRMWRPRANTIVAFDEVGYVENLSSDMRALVQQYWREGRSVGITVLAMKQRPQGALRDMHSETSWTIAFAPKDRGDLERWAELFGARRDWMPVFDSLDPDRHEFIIRHSRSREAYISWVDVELVPQKVKEGRGYEARVRGRST